MSYMQIHSCACHERRVQGVRSLMKTLDIKRILKNSTILLRKLKLGIDIFKVLEYYIEYVIVLFRKSK